MSTLLLVVGSDVRLDSDKVSREKGRTEKQRSDKVWRDWYDDIKPDCYDISFIPKTAFPDIEEPYWVPSRVLGTVYQENSAEVQDEIWSYIWSYLKLDNSLIEDFDQVICILTDQSECYKEEERRRPRCPYWDDTCTLAPILGRISPKIKCLSYPADSPLDNLDAVRTYLAGLDLPNGDVTVRVPKALGYFATAIALHYGEQANYI